jgi:hypothetical protein
VVLTIQILGFTSAYYWRNRLDITVEQTTLGFNVVAVFFNAFGDFSTLSDNMTGVDWFLFFMATFLILLIMMNLFIGILSEQLSEILENRDRNEYKELCELVFLLENFMICKTNHQFKH